MIPQILTLVIIIIGSLLTIFIYFNFAPVIDLNIIPTWCDENNVDLVIRYEIENKSKVRVVKPEILTQLLIYDINMYKTLSEFVPFKQSFIAEREKPIEWSEPNQILTKTKRIYPGEKKIVERFYKIEQNAVAIHIGLNIKMEFGFWGKFVTRKKEDWSQTTTRFIIKSKAESRI